MKKLIKNTSLALLIAGLFCSCSASWHLQRAIEKDPSILHEDTITVTIPEIRLDTVFLTDTVGLQGDIDSIFIGYPDTCKELIKPIIKYITEYQYLKDTIYFEKRIDNDSLHLLLSLSGWQVKDSLFLSATLEEGNITTKTHYVVQVDQSWFSKRWEIFLLSLLLLLTILFIVKR